MSPDKLRARTAGVFLVVVGLAVIAFGALVHPPPGVSATSSRYDSMPGFRMLFEGGTTLIVGIVGIGAAVFVLGVVMLLRAGRLDTAWANPLN